jgi:hypothetical protein
MTAVVSETRPAALPDALFIDVPLRAEIEQFLYYEAELLDDRRFDDWLSLCADDIFYWMPMRRNRLMREVSRESTEVGELAHFEENKKSLGWRVAQLGTGMHWAEDPPSRTRHLVTNVRVLPGPAVQRAKQFPLLPKPSRRRGRPLGGGAAGRAPQCG